MNIETAAQLIVDSIVEQASRIGRVKLVPHLNYVDIVWNSGPKHWPLGLGAAFIKEFGWSLEFEELQATEGFKLTPQTDFSLRVEIEGMK